MDRASFEFAVRHVGRHGDSDVFPFHPENHLLHDEEAAVVSVLEQTHADFETRLNTDSTAGVSAMSPVGYTGFRWATQLDPLWNVYLLAMVIELGARIEAARVPTTMVHSHRFDPGNGDSHIFTRDGYLAFQSASLEESESSDWVVVTDIADFYPRIYHHRLENALREVDDKSDLPKRIMKILGLWSNNTSYGLPIGGPAARFLSELVLNRTDKLLEVKGIQFHRYADDYRIFAGSKEEAHRTLAHLSEVLLRNEGLALSKPKTRVMSRSEFQSTLSETRDAEGDEGLTPEQRDRRRRARDLLGLSLRYDPYSPTAIQDYEALKDAVERIDIVDLFMLELSKPRIDPRLTRKLLRALEAAEPSAKGYVCVSLLQNLELLAPLIPQVLQAIRKVLSSVDEATARESRRLLATALAGDSHLFRLEVNLAFAVRVLADAPPAEYEPLFAQLFDTSQPFIQRDVVLAMARWRATYWLSDKKSQYESFHPWVKRAFLMASYSLGDEGNHWRNSIRNRLSPFDAATRNWVASKIQSADWQVPL